MKEYQLTYENLIVACVMTALLVALLATVIGMKLNERRDRKRDESTRESAISREQYRIKGLPKLDTTYLLEIPETTAKKLYGEDFAGNLAGTFSNRYDLLAIVDREGRAYVGLTMPKTLESLRESEFTQGSYWVPFRGPGEAYSGRKVVFSGGLSDELTVEFYPLWLDADKLTNPDWSRWADLERDYRAYYIQTKISYHKIFDWILPSSFLHEVSSRRHALSQTIV